MAEGHPLGRTRAGCRRTGAALLLSLIISQFLVLRTGALLSSQQLGEDPGAHAIVSTPDGYLLALGDAVVSRIHVTQDILMSEDAWPPHVIRITRNLTVESAEHDQRLINYTYVAGKVLLDPGVHLLFKNVVMAGMSIGSCLNFITASPGAVVIMQGGAWKAPVCPPYGRKMMSVMMQHPRPVDFPGQQNLAAATRPFCINLVCYHHVFLAHDWASSQPLDADELELGAYTTLLIDMSWACDVMFTDECVVLKGYEICRKEMLALHLSGLSNTYDKRWRAAVVTIAVAVIAVAIIAASGPRLLRSHSSKSLQGSVNRAPSGLHNRFQEQREIIPVEKHSPNLPPNSPLRSSNNVQLGSLLGTGSFGSVFRGSWEGRLVAVKIIAHGRQSGKQIHNEAAVSMAAVHPNVVRTFHHFTLTDKGMSSVKAAHVCEAAPMAGQSLQPSGLFAPSFTCLTSHTRHTWIVSELCDRGALPGHLAYEVPRGILGHIDHVVTLSYALDVAMGMAYLHKHNVCHGDLKASNTLVMSSPSPDGRPVCKISDFGLSRVLAANRTHLSTNTIGTITHMPPELLLDGFLTKECDVYSYGILLWEIASGGQAMYTELNPAQIIQKVAVRNERPDFPSHIPPDYVNLAGDCWQADVYARPSFNEVVMRLQGMLQRAASGRARVPRDWSIRPAGRSDRPAGRRAS